MLAAVVNPLTISPRATIEPAPRNPIPEATWAAIREGVEHHVLFDQEVGEAVLRNDHDQTGADANQHMRSKCRRPTISFRAQVRCSRATQTEEADQHIDVRHFPGTPIAKTVRRLVSSASTIKAAALRTFLISIFR
jgi:hypothetical protein